MCGVLEGMELGALPPLATAVLDPGWPAEDAAEEVA